MSNITTAKQPGLLGSQKFQKRLGVALRLIIALFLIAFAIFPVIWIISASFDNSNSLSGQSLIPQNAGIKNFERLFNMDPTFRFGDLNYWRWLYNSIKVSGISTKIGRAHV